MTTCSNGYSITRCKAQKHKNSGKKADRKYAIKPEFGNDGDQNRRHSTRGTADLEGGARKRTNDDARKDRGDQSRRRIRAAAYAESQCQRKRHRRNGKTRHKVACKSAGIVALKLALQHGRVLFKHSISPSN